MKYIIEADKCSGDEFWDMQYMLSECSSEFIEFVGIEITDKSITVTTEQMNCLLSFGNWVDFAYTRIDEGANKNKFDPFVIFDFSDDDVDFYSGYFHKFATMVWGDDFGNPSDKYLVK